MAHSDAEIQAIIAKHKASGLDLSALAHVGQEQSSTHGSLVEQKVFWDRVVALAIDPATTAHATTRSQKLQDKITNGWVNR